MVCWKHGLRGWVNERLASPCTYAATVVPASPQGYSSPLIRVVVGVDEWWRQGARGGRVAFPVGIVAVGWGGTCSLVGAWGIVLALVRMPHLCICI